jgi:hypothetical protein
MYDIFYVSKANGNDTDWAVIKSKYPLAQRLTNITLYEEIRSKSFTKMFWVIWDDIDLTSFNLLDHKATKWDDMYVHVFKNGEHYDGICLIPKSILISQREFDNRFFISKKEIDIVASIPKKFDKFNISTYDEYLNAIDCSTTDMFWAVWPDIEINSNFKFDYKVPKHNFNIVHVFKNGEHYDGICLFPKNVVISQREFHHRFFTEKKEIDIVASTPKKYNVYSPNTFEEYQKITDEMFWLVWPEVTVIDTTVFDMYFSHHNSYDRKINHAFKHIFNGKEITVNSLVLLSKQMPISQREFSHRFLIEKKEYDRVVSKHRLYDVVFISYNESNADKNYERLLEKCPRAKRIHGVKGIHNAHIKAASICDTDMIWIVDGDAIIENDFNFELVYFSYGYDIDCVHVWRSRNPINNLEYGNGGVKLLPRQLTLDMDVNTSDMTTSISKKFKAMDTISNINEFNTDEFTTWRSAFRECCKLASRVIERQFEEETQQRLDTWCNEGLDKQYGEYAINGAIAGRDYGLENKNNLEALKMINDFTWLEEQFNERCRKD